MAGGAGQGHGDRHALRVGHRPIQGRPDVVDVRPVLRQPFGIRRGFPGMIGAFEEFRVEAGVPLRDQLAFAAFPELRRAVQMQGLELAVARLLAVGEHQEGFVDQATERGRDVPFARPVRPGDGGRGVAGETAAEAGEATEDFAVTLVEQAVAPVDDRAQGRLARLVGDAWPAVQHLEALMIEPGADPLQAQGRHQGRGHFQRQRNAVEATADLGNRPGIAFIVAEAVIGGADAIDEQGDGVLGRQRFEAKDDFLRQSQDLLAGRQDGQVRRQRQQPLDQITHRLGDIFAGIENQQHALLVDHGGEDASRIVAAAQRHAQDLGDRAADRNRIAHRPEIDQMHAAGKALAEPPAQLDRQPGLADAAGSDRRHRAVLGKIRFQLGQFRGPADAGPGRVRQADRRRQELRRRQGGRNGLDFERELVALVIDRRDATAADDVAQHGDLGRYGAVGRDAALPDRLQDFVLAGDPSRPFDQEDKQIEWPLTKTDLVVAIE